MTRPAILFLALVAATAAPPTANAAQPSLDGITIIDFKSAQQVLASGDYLVVFVSSRGTYAAVVSELATGGGCIASAVEGTYTRNAIEFGVEDDLTLRRQARDTVCPRFSLHLEGDGYVRIQAAPAYNRRHRVVAHVPFVALDFGAEPFTRVDFGGVRLGPVSAGEDVATRATPGNRAAYAHKWFRKTVGAVGDKHNTVQGQVAPADITGWPWDVLYTASYVRHYDGLVATETFRDAVLGQYGEPSSSSADGRYWVWLYDLDGRLVKPGTDNVCAVTAGYWLQQVSGGAVDRIRIAHSKNDLGPWSCSLMVDLNARGTSGGVDHYMATATSGYAMAMSHFYQRIAEPLAVMEKMQALKASTPEFR